MKILHSKIVIDGVSGGVPPKEHVFVAKTGGFPLMMSALSKDRRISLQYDNYKICVWGFAWNVLFSNCD